MAVESASLEHKTRKQIYNYIYSNPGVPFKIIMNFLSLNKSTLTYHLKYLEKSNQITSKREGRQRHYFCNQQPSIESKNQLPIMENTLNKNQQKILDLVKNQPGISVKDLNFRTRINQSTIEYNLNRLIELKLIWKVKTDNGIGYEYITKDILRKEMFNRLLKKLLTNEIDEETYHRIRRKLEDLDLEELEPRQ
ncbi:MAG: winged helix-turn-helix transcriptional regulator [Thermoplasmata archaeon]|nr:MAG: winged helix-turn-helix transcriptional regulator [Thermoplasmata archaeon]